MSSESWNFGERLAGARRRAGMTLRQLSEVTTAKDQDRRGVLPAQISRIENNTADCSIRELRLLAKAMNMTPTALLESDEPWFVVRRGAAHTRLEEVVRGARQVQRTDDSHKQMIDAGTYKYTVLSDEVGLVAPEERAEGTFPHLMQKYLFQVGRCDEEAVELDAHPGEEIVWVVKGEVEFRVQQPGSNERPKKIVLKEGDCLQYSSSVKHGYRATGESDYAIALFVFSRPLMFRDEFEEVRSDPPGPSAGEEK